MIFICKFDGMTGDKSHYKKFGKSHSNNLNLPYSNSYIRSHRFG